MRNDIERVYNKIQEDADFSVVPCEVDINFDDSNKYLPVDLTPYQKKQMVSFLHQLPSAVATGAIAGAYSVSFPEGLPHTLTALHQGGFGSMIRDNGKFAGTASFYPMSMQAFAMGAFTVMAAASGQYFLTQINNELQVVNTKLDEILEFLYGEKRSELIAEISFVKYAHDNFASIMAHDEQRLSTITNLQEARKIAMKDIDFYINDFAAINRKTIKNYTELVNQTNNALKTKQCIELARQLYAVSALLELFYSENHEKEYIEYMKNDINTFVGKCDGKILEGIGTIKGKFAAYKNKVTEKGFSEENRQSNISVLEGIAAKYSDGADNPLRVAIQRSLDEINKPKEYYLRDDGSVYVRVKDQ